ncbi:uncharacterized protein B0H64DRAFT_437087 [Chaetomium fimeti]|uniref:Uncharacterized protein n=1 Tax=Chaetomium fimeti TaxID=1854472 RepID=A0AAE0HNQ8_9PEZI|nr:hypothetical protein B0H64DRAFT_437087 [Chaetomium fimeti]
MSPFSPADGGAASAAATNSTAHPRNACNHGNRHYFLLCGRQQYRPRVQTTKANGRFVVAVSNAPSPEFPVDPTLHYFLFLHSPLLSTLDALSSSTTPSPGATAVLVGLALGPFGHTHAPHHHQGQSLKCPSPRLRFALGHFNKSDTVNHDKQHTHNYPLTGHPPFGGGAHFSLPLFGSQYPQPDASRPSVPNQQPYNHNHVESSPLGPRRY